MAITFLFLQKDSKQNRGMKALEILFWISLFIVFYTYIGYGILLYILVKIKECFRNFGKLLLVPYIKDFGRITQF